MKGLKPIALWTGLIGALYLLYGSIEILMWVTGEFPFPLMPPGDALAGAMLIIIGSILLYRIRELIAMKYEGLSFLAGGLVLSGIIGIMYILIAGADMLNSVVVGELWAFDPGYNMPAIVLAILLLPGWMCVRKGADFCE